MVWMWSDAMAQSETAPPAGDPGLGMLLTLLQFVPIFLIIYFLLIRPQRQQQKKLQEMIRALKKGDRVLTNGGIYGVVVGIDDAKAVLRIAEDTKVEFTKTAIVQVLQEEAK